MVVIAGPGIAGVLGARSRPLLSSPHSIMSDFSLVESAGFAQPEVMKSVAPLLSALVFLVPLPALAWGSEGHVLTAAIARSRLSADALAKVDAILAQDHDSSTPSDMLSRSYWADVWRDHVHRETAQWHYVDVELDHPDWDGACDGHPAISGPASAGSEDDCVIDKVDQFSRELGDPATPMPERILALKFVLHLVGDLHQPLHVADNHDHGGNCVRVIFGANENAPLHAYWDSIALRALGKDARSILDRLVSEITPQRAEQWSAGDPLRWAKESHDVAVSVAYSFRTPPRCDRNEQPTLLPNGYDARTEAAVATQLERGGVRLAVILERAMAGLDLARLGANGG